MFTLSALTTNVNLVGLAGSLWLGLYLTTRGSKLWTAWLAALGLWVLSAYFFQAAMALNVPDSPFGWMRALIVLIAPLWIHITYWLLPAGMRAKWMLWGIIPLGYALAIIITGLGIFTNLLLSTG